jgi:hypothetical protein
MVGSQNSVGIEWHRAKDWQKSVVSAGDFTTDGEVVDLDRDGDGDILTSCISRDQVEWYENPGNGSRGTWKRHSVGAGFVHDLAAGALNADGWPDVVIFRKSSRNGIPSKLSWLEIPGQSGEGWTRHLIDNPAGEGLDVGDIDGDGDLDPAVSTRWYENADETGQHGGCIWLAKAGNRTAARPGIADIDGDGKKDIVLNQLEGQSWISWFENPSWMEHRISSEELEGVHSLEIAGFDLNGDVDVFVSEMHKIQKTPDSIREHSVGG